jgi:hypothetical protein
MTFSYSLTTDVGQLRLMVGDTLSSQGPRPSQRNFADEELEFFLSPADGLGRASVRVFETLAAEWSSFANITLGPRKEEFAGIAENYRKRAASTREQYGGGSTFSVGWDRQDGYSAIWPKGNSESVDKAGLG